MVKKKLRYNVINMLNNNPGYYATESECVRGVYYVMDGDKFAVCRGMDAKARENVYYAINGNIID